MLGDSPNFTLPKIEIDMFNDDFFDDDFRDIENLVIEFHRMKKGESHGLLSEDDFEYLIDFTQGRMANGSKKIRTGLESLRSIR